MGPNRVDSLFGDPGPEVASRYPCVLRNCWRVRTSAPSDPRVRLRVNPVDWTLEIGLLEIGVKMSPPLTLHTPPTHEEDVATGWEPSSGAVCRDFCCATLRNNDWRMAKSV